MFTSLQTDITLVLKSIQGQHLAASSAIIPLYPTKSGISKENVSSILATLYSKKQNSLNLQTLTNRQQTHTVQCTMISLKRFEPPDKYSMKLWFNHLQHLKHMRRMVLSFKKTMIRSRSQMQ